MRLVAQFDPPDAHAAAQAWRERHAAILEELPDDAVRIDTGRALGGDFVRIQIQDQYADRFAES